MTKDLIYPIFALVLLNFTVAGRLLYYRIRLFRFKDTSPQVAQYEAAASNNFKNLFEVPTMFYAAMILATLFNIHPPALVGLAWIFVAARYCHSFVHCTVNIILVRLAFFQVSVGSLAAIWIIFALNLLK